MILVGDSVGDDDDDFVDVVTDDEEGIETMGEAFWLDLVRLIFIYSFM